MSDGMRVLLIPGGGGSGPGHWHHEWASVDRRCEWVHQPDPNAGTLDGWVAVLDRQIKSSDSPAVLVAHSLGVVVAARWAELHSGPVAGALLVAPADTEASWVPVGSLYEIFRPVPMVELGFPSITVASSNDPFVSVERAAAMSSAWASELRIIGELGHIGSDCELGMWSKGRDMLDELIEAVDPR